jgi:UDP-N-acetylmuramyl tripeptide synthase
MSARTSAAFLAGRLAAGLSRRLGRGGGTVIAGHVAQRLAPRALAEVTRKLPHGAAVVSGTNGKTTTTRLLTHILAEAGLRSLHNRAGANLLTGLFTAAANQSDWRGRVDAHAGVLEVDEATLPATLKQVSPRVLLLHNIFRDQLDRYGEVHYVAGLWREAVKGLHPQATLALNVDDPQLAALAEGASPAESLTYGVTDPALGTTTLAHAADARLCPKCGASLEYELSFYGHLGWYRCGSCGFQRPTPQVAASRVELRGDTGAYVAFTWPKGTFAAEVKLPGLYNVYNALAAVAAALAMDIAPEVIARALSTFTGAFGRLERVKVEDRELFIALVKNPVGFTEVLRMVTGKPGERTLLIGINDRFADGTDVSWLWDVEFEMLQGRVANAVCTGIRGDDMAVRLKYAGIEASRIKVEPDLDRALDKALALAEPGETLYVLPTYTAMLETRDLLRRLGYVKGFWED